MFSFYLFIACITVPLAFVSHWMLGRKRLDVVYRINMVMYSLYFIAETSLAFADPSQLPVLIFNVVNLWAIWQAFRGYRNLKKD